MDKIKFINDLKESLIYHYSEINEEEKLISYGIYSDGDASTISIFYNTEEHLEKELKKVREEYLEQETNSLYVTFFMEEWKKDISDSLREKRLNILNEMIDEYGSQEYNKGNTNYKDEIFDLFTDALVQLKKEGVFKNESSSFFLHLEVSDDWIDNKMINRISLLQTKSRFLEYKKYADKNNE